MRTSAHKTWVEISAKGYSHNLKALETLVSAQTARMLAVKSNAYGHGIDQIVQLALKNQDTQFGVDSLDEALMVQKRAPESTICILGYTPQERFAEVISNGFVQTVYDEATVEVLGKHACEQHKVARVNIKVETGTHRQGVMPNLFKHLLASIEKQRGAIEIFSISSHFSSSEDIEHAQTTKRQHAKFKELLEQAKSFGAQPHYIHISCSASTILYPQTHHSLVRIGIAQYGIWPSDAVKTKKNNESPSFTLEPILSWKTRIAQQKDIPSGAGVGYGETFHSDRPMRIAIIPVGYYDGFIRALAQTPAHVLVKGRKCKILGSICMNMSIVDVSCVPDVRQGDVVTLIGRDGMHEITAQDHAIWTNTIAYEVTTRINPLIPRIIT